MTSKLRIRIGDVEVEYEGSEDFLQKDLPQLLRTAIELHSAGEAFGGGPKPKKKTSGSHEASVPSLTTGSIAAKIGVGSGSDLLKAAAAHLTLVEKKETFSRQELLAQMQTAKGYYKKTYSSNLSNYFATALSKEGFLTETSSNEYTLSAAARKDMEKQLADG